MIAPKAQNHKKQSLRVFPFFNSVLLVDADDAATGDSVGGDAAQPEYAAVLQPR